MNEIRLGSPNVWLLFRRISTWVVIIKFYVVGYAVKFYTKQFFEHGSFPDIAIDYNMDLIFVVYLKMNKMLSYKVGMLLNNCSNDFG